VKYTLLIILIICCLSCNKSDLISRQDTWKTVHVSGESALFGVGGLVTFHGDTLIISDDKRMQSYKMVVTDDRLIIETINEKLLFRVEYGSDSVMVLKELYSITPVTINLLHRVDNKLNNKNSKLRNELL
jgi:hypothetical protein